MITQPDKLNEALHVDINDETKENIRQVDSSNIGQDFNLSEYVKYARDSKGIKSKWLSNILQTSESNFSDKLDKDRLTAKEFIELAIILNIDVNNIIKEIKDRRN